MELPKFTAPTSMAPNLSLTNSVQNAGNVSIPSVQAPKLDNLMGGEASSKVGSTTGALGNLGSIAGGAAIGGLAGAAVGKLTGKNSKITALGGAVVGGLVGASAGKLTSGVGNNVDSVKSSMSNLQGAARAKVMANAPELPEQAKGMSGVMEKGVDLGKFQQNSVGNLMSKVSDFSPGKSITDLAKEKDIASGLKDKLNSLKPSGALGGALSGAGIGAVAGALSGGGKNLLANAAKGAGIGAVVGGITGAASNAASGITGKIGSSLGGGVANTIVSGAAGALGGAALGKLTGQSVNVKNVAGNLVGSVGGGIGAQIGSKLVGSTVPMTGIGAAAGGVIAGMVGGSAGKKALTGIAAGIGISSVTGLVTNKINNTLGVSNQSTSTETSATQPTTATEIADSQSEPVSQSPAPIPDLSKNTTQEIQDLADKSSQSVPPPQPVAPPSTSIAPPSPNSEEAYLTTGTSTANAIEDARQINQQINSNSATAKFSSSEIISKKLFMVEMAKAIEKRYIKFYKAKTLPEIRSYMEKDIAKVSAADKALVKDVISSYKGTFSMAYSGFTDNVMSDPENRILSLNDYLAMDSEDFYKLLTNVAEGQFELKPLTTSLQSTKPSFKAFISKKSDSEVNVTISSLSYGTGTSTIPRATPPPIDVLFNMKSIKQCVGAYHFGKEYPDLVASEGTMNTLDPKDGAYFRAWAAVPEVPNGGGERYCCGNNIVMDQNSTEETYVNPAGEKYIFRDLKETPKEVRWDLRGWVAKIKIAQDLYYIISYNPYTIQINTVQVLKLVPKT